MIYPKTNKNYNFILNKICLTLNVKLYSKLKKKKNILIILLELNIKIL